MKEIGGYFELDLHNNFDFPHADGILLNTGRNALEYILRSISIVNRIYIPYYTCHTVLQPIKQLNINFEFYHINADLEIDRDIVLLDNEYILYTNYFGLKDTYIKFLSEKYSNHLIVDYAQALFSQHDFVDYCFYTPHKFVGVVDGGIAFSCDFYDLSNVETDVSCYRSEHLFIRYDKPAINGYKLYKENSRQARNQPIKRMSNLTLSLLKNIDFEMVKKRRIHNFNYLHEKLQYSNLLKFSFQKIPPMFYPYRTSNVGLREILIEHGIFIPQFWPNVLEWCASTDLDYKLVQEIMPLPIDQRYNVEDMKYIIDMIEYYG